MLRVESIGAVRETISRARKDNAKLVLVPTMGALHAGHEALLDEARRRGDLVVASIFVNPLQFGPTEDLSRYPRPIERDAAIAEAHGVDVLFTPTVAEMYGSGEGVGVRLAAGPIGAVLEGAHRPGHFDGVLTVVAKLFNIVQPDIAVFGQKDIQQFTLIAAMVAELNFPVELVRVATVREQDGLALSSRNVYLAPQDRAAAAVIPATLAAIAAAWRGGETDPAVLEAIGRDRITAVPAARVDYLSVVDPIGLAPVAEAGIGSIVATAVRFGTTRLLDNMILGEEPF